MFKLPTDAACVITVDEDGHDFMFSGRYDNGNGLFGSISPSFFFPREMKNNRMKRKYKNSITLMKLRPRPRPKSPPIAARIEIKHDEFKKKYAF